MRAVVPASGRLADRKLRDLIGGSKKDVHLATEDDLRRDYPTSSSGLYRRSGALGATR